MRMSLFSFLLWAGHFLVSHNSVLILWVTVQFKISLNSVQSTFESTFEKRKSRSKLESRVKCKKYKVTEYLCLKNISPDWISDTVKIY